MYLTIKEKAQKISVFLQFLFQTSQRIFMQQSAQVTILGSIHKLYVSDAIYFLLLKISLEAERKISASSVPRKAKLPLLSVTN